MFGLFSPRVLLNAVAVVSVVLIVTVIDRSAYRRGFSIAEAACAKERSQAADVALQRQKELIKSVASAAQEAQDEQNAIADRLAGADDAVERLRAALRETSRRADAAASAVSDETSARTILAECAGRYRDVAREADRLRAVVLGLQAYARAVAE